MDLSWTFLWSFVNLVNLPFRNSHGHSPTARYSGRESWKFKRLQFVRLIMAFSKIFNFFNFFRLERRTWSDCAGERSGSRQTATLVRSLWSASVRRCLDRKHCEMVPGLFELRTQKGFALTPNGETGKQKESIQTSSPDFEATPNRIQTERSQTSPKRLQTIATRLQTERTAGKSRSISGRAKRQTEPNCWSSDSN